MNGRRAGGWTGGRAVLWPIDTKLAVWVAYIKRQLGIDTQVSLIKVKVTVTKNRNLVFAQ